MKKKIALTPIQILSIGFGLIILIGGILLSLPICNKDGKITPFINGLFTATSSTCVTGLSVYDIYSQYNLLGQFTILVLIQVGGLGFIAVAMIFSTLLGSKITLRQKTLIAESIGATKYGGLILTIKRMFYGTVLIEGLGAIIIASRLISDLGLKRALWFGVFHSVSAFCNAGFDLFGIFSPGSSIITKNQDPYIEFTIMFLIVSGGIGFIVWNDIAKYRFNFKKYPLHSKIMLTFTGILIILGAIIFYSLEHDKAFCGMPLGGKLMNSLFASITPRTAGFASVDYANMSTASRGLTMILMLIGAGPGSTGGGMKVTTILVVILGIQANVLNYNDYSIFRRRITNSVKKRAFSSTSAYMVLLLLTTFLLLILNPSVSFEAIIYEAISALGTVGLTLDLTPHLSTASKILLISLMYLGRLGSLSIAMAVARRKFIPKISYPEESITV